MTRSSFDILCLSPAGFDHPAIAVAAARAGGIGLIDCEFCSDAAVVTRELIRALDATDGALGLRVLPDQADLAVALLEMAAPRTLKLVLVHGDVQQTCQTLVQLRSAGAEQVWIEVTDADQLNTCTSEPDGYVLKGHEAPGFVGDDTAYILLQKAVKQTRKPVFVRGGVGLHTAAACRLAGAAGVVLDDQCLLLRESPLNAEQQDALARLNGGETRLLGEHLSATARVYAPPKHTLWTDVESLEQAAESDPRAEQLWAAKVRPLIGWDTARQLAPIGQGIGVATTLRSLRTVGRLVQALRKQSQTHIEQAAAQAALSPDAPLAQSHGTRYPVVQGPMTRVSDSAAFACRVAQGGGLPMLALALMRGEQVSRLLEETRASIGDAPWGIGLLGFVPQQLREEQIKAVLACKPSYALIAGGRPDQAAHFESEGIPAYIHAPAPALLKMYLDQGARRFVFEGRECGGHIGPIASFPLWEQMIHVLLAQVKPADATNVHVLFAGGIHDAQSSAMVAAMAAPLVERGMKVGVLMGSAYLFTQDIVDAGAIVSGFQSEAVACRRTVSLATGPGHASRCADTAFAREFFDTRRNLIAKGAPASEVSEVLEDLNLGRLRIASKGVNRDASGQIVEIGDEDQHRDGMYMIGQVATLADGVQTIESLHESVSTAATARLADWQQERESRNAEARPSDIAIVGIGTLLPKANDPEDFWNIVLNKRKVTDLVPKSRWDWELYYDPDKSARDKVYSKWGGFLDEIAFDPLTFGIPPKSMKSIDPMQLLCLEATHRALADAGYADGDFDRENTSIMLGAGGGVGDLGMQYGVRAEIPRFVDAPSDAVWDRLPEWTQESFAGVLQNVAAGRVANRLDFGGRNFTVDAACASSLAAVSLAVDDLESGRANVALAGGVDTVQGPFGYLCFSKTQALSPTGTARSFDKGANGIVISEGAAVLVLKRLADAERDGDRIYAVIKSVAGSSDGKALGMTAPRPEGQMRALDRAYAKAGFRPTSLGLIEAHGTGTPVGDKAEAETITRTLKAEGAPAQAVALGSVKTIVGHTKAAAGVTGLIKIALSLHHKVLPAHVGVDDPIDTIADPQSPVYLLDEPRPWLAAPGEKRRAGVSAFGFGGTNFHAVLEAYDGELKSEAAPVGAAAWTQELFVLRASDAQALSQSLGRLNTALRQGTNLPLRDLAYTLALEADKAQANREASGACACIVAGDYDTLIQGLEAAIGSLESDAGRPLPPHVLVNTNVPAQSPSVGFIYPGQGAQYVNMGRESAVFLSDIRDGIHCAQQVLADVIEPGLDKLIWPHAAFDDAGRQAQTVALTDTRVAQPAIGALELGMTRLVRRLGITASAAAGHSYGEYAALAAAGVLDDADFLRLSALRGRVMAEASASGTPGGMAAVQADRSQVLAALEAFPSLSVANHNAPTQTVISGPKADIDRAAAALTEQGLSTRVLPVSGAFHTDLVAAAQKPLSKAIRKAQLQPAQFPVYSNSTGKPYPEDPAEVYARLERHMLSPVEFVAEIEAMYDAGIRLFLEIGPKSICSNMIRQTLSGRYATTVALDGQGGGLRGLLSALGQLSTAGVPLRLAALFEGRPVQRIQLARLAELVKPSALSPTTWYLSGGCARPMDDPILRMGQQPPMQREDAERAQAEMQALREAAHRPAPTAPTTSPHPAPVAAPVTAPASVAANAGHTEALTAYQQTMREFLSLQERVIQQYLAGSADSAQGTALTPELPPVAATPVPAQPAVPVQQPAAAPVSPTVRAVESPIAAPVAAPATAPALDAAGLQRLLLGIVAERTGYPEDMLDLDQDLEAELGVDSIKRVEILGALQKSLPAGLGDAMAANMEAYTQSRSLRDILNRASTELGQSSAPTPATDAAPDAVASAALDTRQLLLSTVAELTGYPEDMLGLEQDMEAELGIDSIKRVEVLGSVQKALPSQAAAAMQEAMERFTQARSLAAIDAELTKLPGLTGSAGPAAGTATAAPSPVAVKPTLLGVVAELTGYPEDMLGLDQDMEAELGIDSIKRVEILGKLQQALPANAGEAMQANMEAFTQARTLSALIALVQPLLDLTSGGETSSAAAVPAAPSTVAQPPATAIDLPSSLVSIVAELTGYPEDMLGLDQDLEAELGIDSIKRVEILGRLQQTLPADAAAQMQADMERYTQARSLQAILDAAATLTATDTAAAAVAPAPTATTAPADFDLTGRLLDIVADRTGYPVDMLGLDQDLEAELGIDSIKRVEIVGALQEALPQSLAQGLAQQMESLTQARSLQAIIDLVGPAQPAAAPLADASPVSASASPSPASSDQAPVYAMAAVPTTAPALPDRLDGQLLITGPDSDLVVALTEAAGARGAAVIRSAESANQQLRWVVDTTGCLDDDTAATDAFFGFVDELRRLESQLNGLQIVSLSQFGGQFGRTAASSSVSSVAGAANGLFNCLRKEYTGLIARAVDFEANATTEAMASRALAEVASRDPAFEAGYQAGERLDFGTLPAPDDIEPSAAVEPAADWVTVVTGGARGITAAVVERLVVPGMRLVLLGRSPLPAAEDAALAAIDDADLQAAVIRQAKTAGTPAKPADIQRQVSRLLADREIRRNLQRLTDAGAVVDYRSCDVGDAGAFRALIESLYEEFGRIDAVLHGAGVIEDKLFRDKSDASFRRVFNTKVGAALTLAGTLREDTLKLCVFFASVAGRYGNQGQGDYAAANETLTRLACQLDTRWPQARVLAVSWGPWDAGMASEAVKAKFRQQGIVPIPLPDGCEHFMDLLAGRASGCAEVIVGEGPWPAPPRPAVETQARASSLPLLRDELRMGPGGSMTLDHCFTLDTDPYLDDHRLDDTPVLPATGALEWMAEFTAAAWPDWTVTEVRDLRALAGVTLRNGLREVHLKARAAAHSDPGSQAIAVEIQDPERKQALYKATVILAPSVPEAPESLNHASLTGPAYDAATIYTEHLFHRARFQLVDAVKAVTDQGVDALARPAPVEDWLAAGEGPWLFDPGLLDVGPQLAIVWARVTHDRTALPSRFGRVRRFGAGAISGPVQVTLRMREAPHAAAVAYDVYFHDAEGQLRLACEDMEGTMTSALNRLTGAQQ
ncbi:MAG: SDR family NAD(P)-dependent oxidoreductase [Pseudomonadota bacterium]|nr:SDR family NAD(P)-dependent oxidoreductase [Pseudomonadota bacterium]